MHQYDGVRKDTQSQPWVPTMSQDGGTCTDVIIFKAEGCYFEQIYKYVFTSEFIVKIFFNILLCSVTPKHPP